EMVGAAARGDPQAISFPRPVMPRGYEFSFSGLKTAVRYFIDRHQGEISQPMVADIAASFQQAVVEVLVGKTVRAAVETGTRVISAVGGVAANSALRAALSSAGEASGLKVLLPPPALCTDNGATVAATAYLRRKLATSGGPISPYSTRAY
ncbi:MAG TPA: tRNA (adenosine(37)-N6)-threonylcarbamoyltransferase complex transferase subunit TsaD, partial [bacterium]|nr:tRNA (adenosine(37)-N6)-threonylcarbamoyltransferase complex transferase subunit TsaD [bacterium]